MTTVNRHLRLTHDSLNVVLVFVNNNVADLSFMTHFFKAWLVGFVNSLHTFYDLSF